jgi:hypothetical protein
VRPIARSYSGGKSGEATNRFEALGQCTHTRKSGTRTVRRRCIDRMRAIF